MLCQLLIFITLTFQSTFGQQLKENLLDLSDTLAEQSDNGVVFDDTDTIKQSTTGVDQDEMVKVDTIANCPSDRVSFELVTGYLYTAPNSMLDSLQGVLMLTECIDACSNNSSCRSINYETGLCLLFSTDADSFHNGQQGELSRSQFSVFTIYMQKVCLDDGLQREQNDEWVGCEGAWAYERVMEHALSETSGGLPFKVVEGVKSRENCAQLCLQEENVQCRSATISISKGTCSLYNVDRHSLSTRHAFISRTASLNSNVFVPQPDSDYLEMNCRIPKLNEQCQYRTIQGQVLKTVDAMYQGIESKDECQLLCETAPFRCRSFDYGDVGDNICRLSHHSLHTLTHINEPYLAIEAANTYQVRGCYNISITCLSTEMLTTIQTDAIFDGKVYSKASPSGCVNDVSGEFIFQLSLPYDSETSECGVEKRLESSTPEGGSKGIYSQSIVVQHHDRIVTSSDLGFKLSCEYDLANLSITNSFDLTIETGASLRETALFEQSVNVESPNVEMRVEDEQGRQTTSAYVGQPLGLIMEILDQDSPYEIFVRDLVALDGEGYNELQLIDDRGCPTDVSIMAQLQKVDSSISAEFENATLGQVGSGNKMLITLFDAFRFPSSQIVQFRALITPCIPTCPPVQCDIIDFSGERRSVNSYGKRRRRRRRSLINASTPVNETVIMSTLQILDRKSDLDLNRHRYQQAMRNVALSAKGSSDAYGFQRNNNAKDSSDFNKVVGGDNHHSSLTRRVKPSVTITSSPLYTPKNFMRFHEEVDDRQSKNSVRKFRFEDAEDNLSVFPDHQPHTIRSRYGNTEEELNVNHSSCKSSLGYIQDRILIGAFLFVFVQVIVLVGWFLLWKYSGNRNNHHNRFENDSNLSSGSGSSRWTLNDISSSYSVQNRTANTPSTQQVLRKNVNNEKMLPRNPTFVYGHSIPRVYQ